MYIVVLFVHNDYTVISPTGSRASGKHLGAANYFSWVHQLSPTPYSPPEAGNWDSKGKEATPCLKHYMVVIMLPNFKKEKK